MTSQRRNSFVRRSPTDAAEELILRVVEDWTWRRYDDSGPWDTYLDERPTHGWRRVLEVEIDGEEWLRRDWHFGRRRPADETALVVFIDRADLRVRTADAA